MKWFSDPVPTKELAQELHIPGFGLFGPAAVFKTSDGYVMGLLRMSNEWPPHSAVKAIEYLTGYKVVSICDPLLRIWRDYQEIPNES